MTTDVNFQAAADEKKPLVFQMVMSSGPKVGPGDAAAGGLEGQRDGGFTQALAGAARSD